MTTRVEKELPETTTARKPPSSERLQSFDKASSTRGISRLQIARVVAALQAGRCEKSIAAHEDLAEGVVREIRRLELARVDRALACVRLSVANTIELVSEQDRSTWDELLEKGA